jgi:hypothetical protein
MAKSKKKHWTGFTQNDLSLVLDFSDKLRTEMTKHGAEDIDSGCGFGGRDMGFEYGGKVLDVHISVREEEGGEE